MIKNKLESLKSSKFASFKVGGVNGGAQPIFIEREYQCGTTNYFTRWGTVYHKDTWTDETSVSKNTKNYDIDEIPNG